VQCLVCGCRALSSLTHTRPYAYRGACFPTPTRETRQELRTWVEVPAGHCTFLEQQTHSPSPSPIDASSPVSAHNSFRRRVSPHCCKFIGSRLDPSPLLSTSTDILFGGHCGPSALLEFFPSPSTDFPPPSPSYNKSSHPPNLPPIPFLVASISLSDTSHTHT
jgi:hypothetical protein